MLSGWIERIGRVVKYWCRIKLDNGSWLETEGPEEEWYCEPSRRLLFHWELVDRNSVQVHLDSNASWQSGPVSRPVTLSELVAISPKLQKHFEKEFGQSAVVIKGSGQ